MGWRLMPHGVTVGNDSLARCRQQIRTIVADVADHLRDRALRERALVRRLHQGRRLVQRAGQSGVEIGGFEDNRHAVV